MGERITRGGYALMNPKQRFTFGVAKIQQKSNYYFLAMFKAHDTNKQQNKNIYHLVKTFFR
jgi:hypothetical protein